MAGSGWPPVAFATYVAGFAAAAGIGTPKPVFQEREGSHSSEELPPVLARTRVDQAKPLLVRLESPCTKRHVEGRDGLGEKQGGRAEDEGTK